MSEPLSKIISNLKNSNTIKNNPEFFKDIKAIKKYCTTDQSIAYFLGLFFRHKCPLNTIEPKIRLAIMDNIQSNNLNQYVNEGKKYSDLSSTILILLFGIIGLLFLFMGIEGISTNETTLSSHNSRLSTTADTAIGKVFVGVAFLIGAFWSLSYYFQRKALEKELLTTESNI